MTGKTTEEMVCIEFVEGRSHGKLCGNDNIILREIKEIN
jgi:hypothetical protein